MNYDISDFIEPASEQEEFLKVLLTAPSGCGKTSSVIYGAPRPLLVFDNEKGSSQYRKVKGFDVFNNKKIKGFDPTDPNNILGYTRMLLDAQAKGITIPYKSILLDSGTELYDRILKDYLQELRNDGQPNKRKLEPNEYKMPKTKFYEIINNLKKLDMHVFVTAHASDNYLKSAFMKIDPNEPIKADCEKKLIHQMDVHYILDKKGSKYTATLKKSRIVDKEGRNLLPPVIENFSNFDLIPMLIEKANEDVGYNDENANEAKNTIRTDVKLHNRVEQIIQAVSALGLSNNDAMALLEEKVNKKSPYELNLEEADLMVSHLNGLLNESSGTAE